MQIFLDIRPYDHKLRIFLSQKFELVLLLQYFLLMNQHFKNMFKGKICSYLQIMKPVYPIKFEIFKIQF